MPSALDEREKATRVQAIRDGVRDLMPALTTYARQHDGRFVLFGSTASGDVRYDSDVDILVDFPLEAELDAWLFAEAQCFARGLRPDIHVKAWRTDRFVARVEHEGRILQ